MTIKPHCVTVPYPNPTTPWGQVIPSLDPIVKIHEEKGIAKCSGLVNFKMIAM